VLDIEYPTSFPMNRKMLGALAGAETGVGETPARDCVIVSAITPSYGELGMGRIVRGCCAVAWTTTATLTKSVFFIFAPPYFLADSRKRLTDDFFWAPRILKGRLYGA
jgi:hypothetical protein